MSPWGRRRRRPGPRRRRAVSPHGPLGIVPPYRVAAKSFYGVATTQRRPGVRLMPRSSVTSVTSRSSAKAT